MATLFIGMPAYNAEKYISKAIKSIIEQSFTDWELLISDNNSCDSTEEICRYYCEIDRRISYIRQPQNIGVVSNYEYLLDKADTEYFMWAAADDEWEKDFLRSNVELLDNDESLGIAFCNIVNIDTYSRVIRKYPSFKKFEQDKQLKRVLNFLKDPEVMGKANLIYGVYRLDACKTASKIMPLDIKWGSDICFVLAVLCRYKLAVRDEVLFFKRISRETDTKARIDTINIQNAHRHIFPLSCSIQYSRSLLKATRNTKSYPLTFFVIILRICNALLNYMLDIFIVVKKKLLKISKTIL